jgi:hypothetical protein
VWITVYFFKFSMAPSHAAAQAGSNSRLLSCIALLLFILIAQIAWNSLNSATNLTITGGSSSPTLRGDPVTHDITTSAAFTSYLYRKSPPAMPSVRISEAEEKILKPHETIYGGKGDKPHLGKPTFLSPYLSLSLSPLLLSITLRWLY